MPLQPGDSVRSRSFGIEIDGVNIAQFRDVQGISNKIAVIEIRENKPNGQQVIRKVPGNSSSGDITLKRGTTADRSLWNWFKEALDGNIQNARKNGSVTLYDYQHGEVRRYNFTNGWCSALNISALSSPGNDIVIEECVISHEGIELA